MKKFFVFLTALAFVSCSKNDDSKIKKVEVDFSITDSTDKNHNGEFAVKPLNVVIASMISPKETFSYYEELIKYVGDKLNIPIEFKQRKTYREVNEMLSNKEVDVAFICSGPYVEQADKKNIEILVVPVSNGIPAYQAYIIAHVKSQISRFEDFKGKIFAFTDPLSNTGYLYAIKRVKELRTTADKFFSKSFFSYAHDNSIQLVERRTVDGASIDGLVLDYLKKFSPERVKNIKIVEKSELYGIPPFVVPKNIDASTKEKLRNIFLTMHLNYKGKKILDKLLIDKFILGKDSDYNSIRSIQRFVQK